VPRSPSASRKRRAKWVTILVNQGFPNDMTFMNPERAGFSSHTIMWIETCLLGFEDSRSSRFDTALFLEFTGHILNKTKI
jgi:hypothetical protein